jgi:NitT/TauT family transport system substrate-binding protein
VPKSKAKHQPNSVHQFKMTRRKAVAGAAAALTLTGLGGLRRARAATTKVRFLTNWYAEAEHGGFYQAIADGLYAKEGLDVALQMGGPQVNGMQLLVGGAADIILGYDIQILNSIEKQLPVVAVGAAFQFDLQGIMTHTDINSLADLKGRRILVASTAYTTYWPWLKQTFGFSDDQTAPYTFNLQPFFADPKLAQQGYVTAEPFDAQKHNVPVKFFLFADDGYPTYTNTLTTTTSFLEKNPDAVAGFVRASMEGWKSYMQDPAPGNKLIKGDNSSMEDDQLAYSWKRLNDIQVVGGGDAKTMGIGIMTEARWEKTRDFLVKGQLLKPSTDWKSAFTTKFVKDLKITL